MNSAVKGRVTWDERRGHSELMCSFAFFSCFLSIFLAFFLSVSLCVSLCVSLSLSLSLCLSVSLSTVTVLDIRVIAISYDLHASLDTLLKNSLQPLV